MTPLLSGRKRTAGPKAVNQRAFMHYCLSELGWALAKVIIVISEHVRLFRLNVCFIACFLPPPVFLGAIALGSSLLKTWSAECKHHPETWKCRILAIYPRNTIHVLTRYPVIQRDLSLKGTGLD